MRIYSLQLPLLLFSFVILGTSLDYCVLLWVGSQPSIVFSTLGFVSA